ncbi:MAG: hypothetical protein PVSMB8_00180 [Vulcanimicrobiaceae bacterium]
MKDMANAHLDTKERLIYAINAELEMLRNRAAMAAVQFVGQFDPSNVRLVWHLTKIRDRMRMLRQYKDEEVIPQEHDYTPNMWAIYRADLETFKRESSEDARCSAIAEQATNVERFNQLLRGK